MLIYKVYSKSEGSDVMRIEKINSNQIKCFLNKNDLISRHIKVSELAYGTDKAQELFRDMMDQASDQVGFDAENVPIMIEAVPLSTDSIMVIITKVDNPDELETKFSSLPNSDSRKFTKKEESPSTDLDVIADPEESDDTMPPGISAFFVYRFKQLDHASNASSKLDSFSIDSSTLYRDPENKQLVLVLVSSDMERKDTKLVRGILSEYGEQVVTRKAIISHYDEHFETIIKEKAVKILETL